MDAQKVDLFLMTNSKYFEGHQLHEIRDHLLDIEDSQWPKFQFLQFKDPMIMLIVSFLGGPLGIDRFMIGDTGLGIAKLITCGGFGIWALIDLFLIMPATKEKNRQLLEMAFNGF